MMVIGIAIAFILGFLAVLGYALYAVKAQEPDGKFTWARRSKRLAP